MVVGGVEVYSADDAGVSLDGALVVAGCIDRSNGAKGKEML